MATVLVGDIEQAEGRIQAALASYQRASALVPDDTWLLVRIADLAQRHGDTARALTALRKLVRLEPRNGQWAVRLAAIEARMKADARRR